MADIATLFKLTAKYVALQHNVIASFMAKPHDDLPGCSGHMHLSLWARGDEDIFAPTHVFWGVEDRDSAIRLIVPEDNKRATALKWSVTDILSLLNAIQRLGGADVNPYLAMAGVLACGLYGIKNKLSLFALDVLFSRYVSWIRVFKIVGVDLDGVLRGRCV